MLRIQDTDAQADVYQVDSMSAVRALEFGVPAWRDLKGVQSESEVDALAAPEQNPSMTQVKNSVWIPPLVLVTILEAQSMNPAVLIPILSTKFQEFDRSCTTIKVRTVQRPVMEFLWAVHKKLVLPTIVAVDSSGDAEEWASRQHFAYICPGPPPFPIPPIPNLLPSNSPFKSMTEELRKIRESAERQLLRDAQT